MNKLKRCRGQYYLHRYFYWGESSPQGKPVLRGDGFRWESNGMDTEYRHACKHCGKIKWKR